MSFPQFLFSHKTCFLPNFWWVSISAFGFARFAQFAVYFCCGSLKRSRILYVTSLVWFRSAALSQRRVRRCSRQRYDDVNRGKMSLHGKIGLRSRGSCWVGVVLYLRRRLINDHGWKISFQIMEVVVPAPHHRFGCCGCRPCERSLYVRRAETTESMMIVLIDYPSQGCGFPFHSGEQGSS